MTGGLRKRESFRRSIRSVKPRCHPQKKPAAPAAGLSAGAPARPDYLPEYSAGSSFFSAASLGKSLITMYGWVGFRTR